MTKEELEKEANKYADEHAFRVPYDGSNKFYDDVDFKASKEGYLAGAKPREKRIAKLEKENAELKEQQFSLRNERNTFLAQNEQYEKDLIDFNGNLTNAKELLKEFIQHYKAKTIYVENMQDLLKQSEQFLSEVEK